MNDEGGVGTTKRHVFLHFSCTLHHTPIPLQIRIDDVVTHLDSSPSPFCFAMLCLFKFLISSSPSSSSPHITMETNQNNITNNSSPPPPSSWNYNIPNPSLLLDHYSSFNFNFNYNCNYYPQEEDEEQEQEQEEEEEEELGAMKEMMYRIAAMQPVDIDPATIRKPKRRNVRISDDPQSVAARHRRERISEKIRILQRLVPGGIKMDTASMLDEAIRYVKFLKRQIRMLQTNPNNNTISASTSSSTPLI